jgi:hypothetical protein
MAWAIRSRSRAHVAVILTTLGVASCRGAAPTSPTGGAVSSGAEVVELELFCPPSLLIGQKGPCLAQARLRSGQTPVVSLDATWASSRPDIVAVDALGVVSGRAGGQASVSASYGGREASATLVVTVEDALRMASGQGQQGDFTPGSTVTLWLQGYYSVASAETGRLSLKITDQARTITTTTPVTVAKGGDFFLMSSTFVVPNDSAEVCRTAVLEVGSIVVSEPNSKSYPLWCVPIRR